MSQKFREFLESQGLVWDEMSLEDQGQLRMELTQIVNEEPSKTVQADAADADINVIVARLHQAGLPASREPWWSEADASSPVSYQDALQMIATAQARFEALPSRVRERFGNDPDKLIRFMDDPANADEAVKLGLVPKPREPERPVGGASGEGGSASSPPGGSS